MEERTIKIVTKESKTIKIDENKLREISTEEVLSTIVSGKLESWNKLNRPFVFLQKSGQMVNPFLSLVHTAFAQHYPILLTPDSIWYCISSGFAIHINENSENLRNQFVSHEGKKELQVRRDHFQKGNPENDWEGVFSEFSDQIKKNIGEEKHSLIVADFSTTGVIEKACSEIVLMDAMKKYFDYSVLTMCGIPEIHLAGTLEDWKKIKDKSTKLREIDPKNEKFQSWLVGLDGVLNEFINAFNGTINEQFWNSIYKFSNASGGPRVTGWINLLFPYLQHRNKYYWNNFNPEASIFSAATPNSFPLGVSKAPFKWYYLSQEFDMEFIGGIFGASQDSNGLLRPEFGWAVLEKTQIA